MLSLQPFFWSFCFLIIHILVNPLLLLLLLEVDTNIIMMAANTGEPLPSSWLWMHLSSLLLFLSLPDRNCNELHSTFPCDDICRLHDILSGKTCSGCLVDCFSCRPHDWHRLSWREITYKICDSVHDCHASRSEKKKRQTSGSTSKYSPVGSFTSGRRSEVFLLLDNQSPTLASLVVTCHSNCICCQKTVNTAQVINLSSLELRWGWCFKYERIEDEAKGKRTRLEDSKKWETKEQAIQETDSSFMRREKVLFLSFHSFSSILSSPCLPFHTSVFLFTSCVFLYFSSSTSDCVLSLVLLFSPFSFSWYTRRRERTQRTKKRKDSKDQEEEGKERQMSKDRSLQEKERWLPEKRLTVRATTTKATTTKKRRRTDHAIQETLSREEQDEESQRRWCMSWWCIPFRRWCHKRVMRQVLNSNGILTYCLLFILTVTTICYYTITLFLFSLKAFIVSLRRLSQAKCIFRCFQRIPK